MVNNKKWLNKDLVKFMVRFLVYINNKLKVNNRFTFSGTVMLTKPCPLLVPAYV